MTPKQRVMARLAGKPVDRIPNFNILMMFAARYIGRGMDEFCRDHRIMVAGNMRANEDFGIDLLNTMSDAYRETADYGAPIRFPLDSLPVCEHLIKGPHDIHKLKAFHPEERTRMLDRVKAIECYKREGGEHWPIMGWVEGCAAESADLMGLTDYIMAIYDEPEMVREMMDICLETACNCVRAQVQAGADIIGVGDAVASVMGPTIYREWVLDYQRRIFDEIHHCGAIGRLHICGDITLLLDDLRTCGADIIDIDWMVDFKAARDKLKGAAMVCGNFNPVSILLDGTPEIVHSAVNDCVEAGGDDCIIMAGCEVPRDTPYENLRAVAEALGDIGL